MHHRVDGLVVHCFERVAQRRSCRIPAGDAERVHVVDGHRLRLAGENPGQGRAERDRRERTLIRLVLALQNAIEPSVGRALHARRARFHVVLRIEVRARGVGRAGGVHDGKVPLVPQRLEAGKRGMQAKESIQVNDAVPRNSDAGPHLVIGGFSVRDDDVQSVSGAALKDHYKPLVARGG